MLAKVAFATILIFIASMHAIAAEEGNSLAFGESVQNKAATVNYSLSINVDILPGICPNTINITGQGLLPIAVLGTKDFDASTIDPSTINLTREGFAGKIAPFRWHYEDVTAPFVRDNKVPCQCLITEADKYTDLLLEFDIYKLVKLLDLQKIAGNNVVLNLSGNLQENASVQSSSLEGSDCISMSDVSQLTDPRSG